MQADDFISSDTGQQQSDGNTQGEIKINSLVRLKKKININSDSGGRVDDSVVSPQFYNSINYSLLPSGSEHGKLVIGITSASPGDGKTLVASNLAVSLALAQERSTVLVDLNIAKPRLHNVFDVPLGPGLLEALHDSSISISTTLFKNLSILSAGSLASNPANDILLRSNKGKPGPINEANLGLLLEQLPEFRNVIYSLLETNDFIIVDLPSMRDITVPALFLNQLDGIIVVVTAGVTKQEDIDEVIAQIEPQQILGFVLNRAK